MVHVYSVAGNFHNSYNRARRAYLVCKTLTSQRFTEYVFHAQNFITIKKALLSFFQPSLEDSKAGNECGWKKLPAVFALLVPGGERCQPDLGVSVPLLSVLPLQDARGLDSIQKAADFITINARNLNHIR